MENGYIDIELALYEKDYEKLYDLEDNRITEIIQLETKEKVEYLLRYDDFLIQVRTAQKILRLEK